MKRYPRSELASSIADDIEGLRLFDEGRNGLFLAAPRRTGKTTFLREDLGPLMTERGYSVVYVDLWEDLGGDPGALIDTAIGDAIRERLGTVAKATLAAGVQGLDVAGVPKIDTTRIGEHDGMTLPRALGALRKVSAGPIVLMIDEAQHALTSERGAAAMTALKSARDTMNSPDDVHLRLVMTGSDRDKLLRLVSAHDAPFLGSRITALPMLDDGFIDFVAGHLEKSLPDLAPIDVRVLALAFSRLGHQPTLFEHAISDAVNPLSNTDDRFEKRLLLTVDSRLARERADLESLWHGLDGLDRGIVRRILELRSRFRPFDADALAFYDRELRAEASDARPATRSRVQNALIRLRRSDPPLLWKSARGEYALADATVQAWHDELSADGRWPPAPPRS